VHDATADEYRSFAIVQLDVQHDAVTPIGLTLLAYQSVRPVSSSRVVRRRLADLKPPLAAPGPSAALDRKAQHRRRRGRLHHVPRRSRDCLYRCRCVVADSSPPPEAQETDEPLADSTFEEAFPLRQNSTRFLGLSMPTYLAAPLSPTETLSLLTSSPSLVTVTVTAPHGSQQRVAPGGVEALKTQRLKTRLEQAIFYGTREAENPLAFDIQPDFEGDLAKASTAVSADILASSASPLPLQASDEPA